MFYAYFSKQEQSFGTSEEISPSNKVFVVELSIKISSQFGI